MWIRSHLMELWVVLTMKGTEGQLLPPLSKCQSSDRLSTAKPVFYSNCFHLCWNTHRLDSGLSASNKTSHLSHIDNWKEKMPKWKKKKVGQIVTPSNYNQVNLPMGFLKTHLLFYGVQKPLNYTDWWQPCGPVNMRSLNQTFPRLIIFFISFNNLFLHDQSYQLHNPILSLRQHQMLDQRVSKPDLNGNSLILYLGSVFLEIKKYISFSPYFYDYLI